MERQSARQAARFYEQTRCELPAGLKIKWVLADSGFGEEEFLERLEADGQRYIVALRLTGFVQRAICEVKQWRKIEAGIEVREATVALRTWKKARRMVFVRQHVPSRPQASGKQPMLFKELEDHCEWR